MKAYTTRFRHRRVMPVQWVMIVEDDLERQRTWCEYLLYRYGEDGQSKTAVTVVWNADQAISLMAYTRWPLWIAMDYDIQIGNGEELTRDILALGYDGKIIAQSGLASNNDLLMAAGCHYRVEQKAKSPGLGLILDHIENR